MIRSLRLTLSVWYLAILTATLCLFGWVLYTNVASSLSQEIDDVLVSHADGVSDSLFAFWEAAWGAEHPDAPLQPISGEIDAGRFAGIVDRWRRETGALALPRAVRVIDRAGRPLQTSAGFGEAPLTAAATGVAQRGRTVYEMFQLAEHRVRVVTRPVIESGRVLYFVQVAAPLRQADASLERLRAWLLWLIPSTLVLTSFVGWFLASTALRPVGRMITQAQRIGAEHLHERIDVPRTGDELEQLAATFNGLLARLERAFRRLRQFSAAASHELRTPLTVMKGELEVALRKARDAAEYQRVLRAHLDAVNDLTRTVEELLLLGRSEAGEGMVEWRPVELTAAVERVRGALQLLAANKGISVALTAPGPVWVRGEQRLLERLIANLLDNALKHTPPQGRITCTVDARGPEARLLVQDTGPGIPAGDLPHVFDRFFSRRPAAEDASSTGLGLGLCRWIAEAHQGRIEVVSPPGQGALLTVWLPHAPPPA